MGVGVEPVEPDEARSVFKVSRSQNSQLAGETLEAVLCLFGVYLQVYASMSLGVQCRQRHCAARERWTLCVCVCYSNPYGIFNRHVSSAAGPLSII